MDNMPRVPSKSENHARVRCQGAEKQLSSIKGELDRICHTQARALQASRNRFVLDRRRSLGNVYNSLVEGIQPRERIRRKRRRGSAPEVVEIFRRQEERRQSVKVMEKAMSRDVMRRLERKYQEALAGNGSDVEEEDWAEEDAEALLAPNRDIEGPDYERGLKDLEKEREERKREKPRPKFPSSSFVEPTSTLPPRTSKQPAPNHHHHALSQTQNHHRKKKTGHENRNDFGDDDEDEDEDDGNTTTESVAARKPLHPDVTKLKASFQPAASTQIPQRKRSHSDGNIFMNILELDTRVVAHPYAFATGAAAAGDWSDDEDDEDSEDEVRMPFQRRTLGAEAEAWASRSSSGTSDKEISDSENDVSYPSPRARRRVGEVSFNLPSPDVTGPPRQQADVILPTPQSDVMRSPRILRQRGGSYPRDEEIRLSPSLQRRLASIDLSPSRPRPDAKPDVGCSPTGTRRRRDEVRYASPKTTPRNPAPTPDLDSPTPRRKGDRPKRFYQQGEAEKQQARKRRPLRRSSSEHVAFAAARVVFQPGRKEFRGARAARRGSDSLQGVGATPRVGRDAAGGWDSLMFSLALSPEEKEDIARHKRRQLVTSLRKRQEEVDSDVSRRIRTFLQRYDDM